MNLSKLTVYGEKQTEIKENLQSDSFLELRESYRVSGASRSATQVHNIQLTEDSIVEVVLGSEEGDSTSWFCSQTSLKEAFPEGSSKTRGGDDSFTMPSSLFSDQSDRGIVSSVIVKAVNVFTKKTVMSKVRDVARTYEDKSLISKPGLYRVDKKFDLVKFTEENANNKPYLLFLHGTASSTKGSFEKLQKTEAWHALQQVYGSNIIAFQHRTLSESPLQNVVDLFQALPKDGTLHVVSHSRGGLVGDILARYCNSNENARGFNDDERKCLETEGRGDDLKNIDILDSLSQTRKLHIAKFVRVACPGSGTILASKRLDNVMNVLLNLIGVAIGSSVVYTAFKQLLVTVIDSKNHVDVLPGLEAMNPKSAFIKALNNRVTSSMIADPLVVISGNCKTEFALKGLRAMASRLFYQRDNDLVVNTNAMYRGAFRVNTIQYFLDDDVEVDHFSYFAHPSTANALVRALKNNGDSIIQGFEVARQDARQLAERNALMDLEMGEVFANTVTGKKPIVILLPGIMGSNLGKGKNLLWINYARFLQGELINIAHDDLKAKSLIRTSYNKLVEFLKPNYDVVTFPFDWRKQLMDCAEEFEEKVSALLAFNQPIKIIGHSMGGVLVRDFIVKYPETWDRLNKSSGFRLIFLGAPLQGSFRIPRVLFGQDPIIEKLAMIDVFNSKKDLLEIFSALPGILSLLPLTTDPENDFSKPGVWKKMNIEDWPVPNITLLKEFQKYRTLVLDGMKSIDYSNIYYIAGKDKDTPDGYQITTRGSDKELKFTRTAQGDQSVTWASGIPGQLIERNAVYYVNVSHGSLANDYRIFDGIADLLATGATTLLSRTRPAIAISRGGGTESTSRWMPETHDQDLSIDGIENTLLGLGQEETSKPVTPSLHLSFANGDVKYATYPVLAGHFSGDGILYGEKVLDGYLNKSLTRRHAIGIYPGPIGSHEMVINEESHFKGAIILGLGKFGELTEHQLIQTVEQGAARYLMMCNENQKLSPSMKGKSLGLSSLIIGSGYGGLTIEGAIRAILQGIQNANEKVRSLQWESPRVIEHIEFIEQYADKAADGFHGLKKIIAQQTLSLVLEPSFMNEKPGRKSRVVSSITEGWWTRIRVRYVNKSGKNGKRRALAFNMYTGGAQEKERLLYSSDDGTVEKLIEEYSVQKKKWSEARAKTIFELLIPNDFKEQLKRQNNIVWIVDKDTAWYPWELLHDATSKANPLAIGAGMIRQLTTSEFRYDVNQVSSKTAAVVADPILSGFLSQLPGAKEEGERVCTLLKAQGFEVQSMINKTEADILTGLFSKAYKIIHLAGHGVFNEDVPEKSDSKEKKRATGMVIGNGAFLTTDRISQMSTVPDLVFINCCSLGRIDGVQEELYRRRYRLAANIGTQLIDNGVKAVIAAGWAVNDTLALRFTEEFYKNMFMGIPFGDSVRMARSSVYVKGMDENTWGAYQCYGDPQYRLIVDGDMHATGKNGFENEREAEIELENLRSEIDTSTQSAMVYQQRLASISKRIDAAQFRNARMTELEALIYADLFLFAESIAMFEQLKKFSDATFAVSSMELYYNIVAKHSIHRLLKGDDRQKLQKKMNNLERDVRSLLRLGETDVRCGSVGSFYKRKSMLESNKTKKIAALSRAAWFYQKGHCYENNHYPVYTLTNWLALEHVLSLIQKPRWASNQKNTLGSYKIPSKKEALRELKKLIDSHVHTEKGVDYLSKISEANLDLVIFMIDPPKKKQEGVTKILERYRKAWDTVGSRGIKNSEVEHLEILIDALSTSSAAEAKQLHDALENIKTSLKKML